MPKQRATEIGGLVTPQRGQQLWGSKGSAGWVSGRCTENDGPVYPIGTYNSASETRWSIWPHQSTGPASEQRKPNIQPNPVIQGVCALNKQLRQSTELFLKVKNLHCFFFPGKLFNCIQLNRKNMHLVSTICHRYCVQSCWYQKTTLER